MSWFSFNPWTYAKEEWNGESALGRYDPLHLFKEAGSVFGLWSDNEHPDGEKIPVAKYVEEKFTGWTYWLIWGILFFFIFVLGIFLLSKIL